MIILNKIEKYIKSRVNALLFLSIFLLCATLSINAINNSDIKIFKTQIVYNNDEFLTFAPSENKIQTQENHSVQVQELALPISPEAIENYETVVEKSDVLNEPGFKITFDDKEVYVHDISMYEEVLNEILMYVLPLNTFEKYKQTGTVGAFNYLNVKVTELKFEDLVTIEEGEYAANLYVKDKSALRYYLFHQGDQKIEETLSEQNTIDMIMNKHQLNETELFINNGFSSDALLYEGQKILVNKLNPLFEYSLTYERQFEEDVKFLVNEVLTDELDIGKTKVDVKGSNGKQEVKTRTRMKNGAIESVSTIDVDIIIPPVTEILLVGTFEKPGVGTGDFGWPEDCKTVTNGYNGFSIIANFAHHAIDIACSHNSPIYAADNGVVIFSGWSPYGGGNEVVVDHKNGYSTRYSHMNSNAVKKGDVVSKGEVVGYQGSTGSSTASHLHFEIFTGDGYVTGKRLNPLDFY